MPPKLTQPADYASRHPVGDPESHSYDVESEEHISFVLCPELVGGKKD